MIKILYKTNCESFEEVKLLLISSPTLTLLRL